MMRQAEFEQHVGQDNICENIAAALERARAVHEEMTTPPVPAIT
jgi:hypothetical protein